MTCTTSPVWKGLARNARPILVQIAGTRRDKANAHRATRTVSGGLVIVKAFHAKARAVAVPARHATTKRALAIKQKSACQQSKRGGPDNGNSSWTRSYHGAGRSRCGPMTKPSGGVSVRQAVLLVRISEQRQAG
jgi:hypothetical protein